MKEVAKAGPTAALTRSCLRRLVLVFTLAGLTLAPAGASAAPPETFWTRCAADTEADVRCSGPRGIAASPVDGHVFVSDSFNNRIVEFTAWGQFVKTFGWGVVASGPASKPRNEIQQLTVDATAGSFKLRAAFNQITVAIPFDASAATLQEALVGLPDEGAIASGPGDFAVSGPAGGPWAIEFTGANADRDISQLEVVGSTLSGAAATATVSTTQPGANFEICVPAEGDACQVGQEGTGAGEFGGPQGIAVDSAGDVYVLDRGLPSNQRVQKFDPEGHFLRMWGKGVNTGTSGNAELCTDAGPPTDVCGPGGEGSGPGQFGKLSTVGSYIAIDTAGTATTADDSVYVGEQERIQRFDTDGAYQSEISVPGETVRALAVDPSGNVFAAFCGTGCDSSTAAKAGIRKWSSAGSELGTIAASNPQALASGPAGELFVVDGTSEPAIRQFSAAGIEVPGFAFDDISGVSTGIATGVACLTEGYDLYASNIDEGGGEFHSFLRAYGSPPDEAHAALCPPPLHAPEIEDQGPVLVEPDFAAVQAKINPKFWKDTSYYVQYGTAACVDGEDWEASCVKQKPASPVQLGAGTTDVGKMTEKVALPDLSPETEYRFRFVSESSGGGPVHGVGGTEAVEGKAGFFTTTTIPGPQPADSCANLAFRTGDSALLPDCRAYEMVSPVDKNGGDIQSGRQAAYVQASPDGERITYTTQAAFGDQPSNKVFNQYVASHEGDGWSNHGINAPLGRLLQTEALSFPFREVSAFSPDLCSEWLADYNVTPLTPDAQEGYVNLYRQDLCDEGGFEALTTAPPTFAGAGALQYVSKESVQGFSEDLGDVLFTAKAGLTPDAVPGGTNSQIYDHAGGGLHLVSVLPNGTADPGSGSRGAEVGAGLTGGVDHAVSTDGSRVYWSSGITAGVGRLFLRINPAQPESARLHGVATGVGDLVGPTLGAGNLIKSSTTVSKVEVASGTFVVGQAISGEGIAAGTTIVAVETGKLKLSKAATLTKTGAELSGAASEIVSNVTANTGAFAVGQEIAGAGIPTGTTVVAAAPGSLTLSAKATQSVTGTALSATSECTEADKACTVPVSSDGGATFWTAIPDGSAALYSEGEVVSAGPGKGTLYRFDAETETRTPIATGLRGVLGASDDLSRIYYVSTDVLAPGQENGHGDEAQAGKPNLYLDEEGTLTFVGTLRDGGDGDASGAQGIGFVYSLGSFNPTYNAARVTPDGGHIAFQSRAQMTHFDNTDANSGEPAVEVFTYEAGGTLHCVSCHPSGVRPSGEELKEAEKSPQVSGSTGVWGVAWIPGTRRRLHASNVLSDSGGRLFFMSLDALVARDTNGAQDVYEWEAPSEGGCTQESSSYHQMNGGCIYLISSGESPFESEFWDASTDGRDVFFTTESSLLPQDPGSIDLYDARVGGGFAQPSEVAACEGEACQSPPVPPNDPTPASSSFQGAGNVVEGPTRKPCTKGKVRRKGRCVTKKHRRRAHHRTANDNRRAGR